MFPSCRRRTGMAAAEADADASAASGCCKADNRAADCNANNGGCKNFWGFLHMLGRRYQTARQTSRLGQQRRQLQLAWQAAYRVSQHADASAGHSNADAYGMAGLGGETQLRHVGLFDRGTWLRRQIYACSVQRCGRRARASHGAMGSIWILSTTCDVRRFRRFRRSKSNQRSRSARRCSRYAFR